jgi:hypothetical protein
LSGEAGPGSPSDNATKLTPADNAAICRVNGRTDHFATAPEQSQHIHEAVAMPAKPSPHQFAMMALFAPGFDDLGEWNGFVRGNRRSLLGLVEAAMLGGIGGKRRRGADEAGQK